MRLQTLLPFVLLARSNEPLSPLMMLEIAKHVGRNPLRTVLLIVPTEDRERWNLYLYNLI